jgi:TolB protein
MKNMWCQLVISAGLLLWSGLGHAVLTIEITKGVETGIPIAIVPFGVEGGAAPPQDVSAIVEADLARSGRFDAIADSDFLSQPHTDQQVRFKDWRLIKAEALVIGKVVRVGADHYQVQFQLFDVFKQKQLAGYRYSVNGQHLRKTAHKIADIVYEKLTGERGAFDTRIAYVTLQKEKHGLRYLLRVADSDGYGPITILDSPEPIMSPGWSPDGDQLVYVSFENRRSNVYIHNLKTRVRAQVAAFKGINSAPAWSPDGRRMALVLSRDGNPEIYIMDLASKQLRRVTRHHAIDTEPAWSPDGRYLVFTSDRSGRPQLYRVSANGAGQPKRITFEGDYNARASYAPDGRRLALVSRDRGRFRIAVLHLDSGALHVLTGASLDESPSFAPNGRMILYATERQGKGVLAAISADGRFQQSLAFQQGEVREPAWSPFSR